MFEGLFAFYQPNHLHTPLKKNTKLSAYILVVNDPKGDLQPAIEINKNYK
ncbi:MAG TPA: hypothetical protein VJY62_00345 [Bacteroidia bacterium]|nr:hypothetical protein [Bacteroidia bacterium]